MRSLEKIINDMALKQFDKDAESSSEFMFKHTKIGEFVEYLEKKGWVKQYGSTRLNNMQGLARSFIYEILWHRLREQYIEATVKMLKSKLDPSIEININYGS
jgi:phosphoribosylaminoimidazole-succinocarboxamide synthase